MTERRYTLQQAATKLGLSVNGVRSRYKAGKLSGGYGNDGKIFVWMDDEQPSKAGFEGGSKLPNSKGSKGFEVEGILQDRIDSQERHIATLTSVIETMQEQMQAKDRQIEEQASEMKKQRRQAFDALRAALKGN